MTKIDFKMIREGADDKKELMQRFADKRSREILKLIKKLVQPAITKKELAGELGLKSPAFLYGVINSKKSFPAARINKLMDIAEKLGVKTNG